MASRFGDRTNLVFSVRTLGGKSMMSRNKRSAAGVLSILADRSPAASYRSVYPLPIFHVQSSRPPPIFFAKMHYRCQVYLTFLAQTNGTGILTAEDYEYKDDMFYVSLKPMASPGYFRNTNGWLRYRPHLIQEGPLRDFG